MQDPELWARIEDHDFPRGFEDKLAQQVGGWMGTMRRVREEYRRFIYLAMISRGAVTPSVAVDQAWHLHLSYTRDYWGRFSEEVLRGQLHHDPCAGPEERPRYKAQYAETIALYEQEFGEVPPLKIWPTRAIWKHIGAGLAVAAVGVVIGVVALAMGDDSPTWRTGTALLLLMAGLLYAAFSSPVQKRGDGAGCGGTAGCGGGGCGS